MKAKLFLAFIFFVCLGRVNAQVVLSETTLYFDSDKYNIKPDYQKVLASLAELIKADTTAWVEISGHADKSGKKEHNDVLSLKRTETVLKYFAKNNVNPSKIKGFHYGSSKPIASNETAEGRSKNRRVEVKVYKRDKKEESVAASSAAEEPQVHIKDLPLRTEIDIHYNQKKFSYLDNSHRSVVHTIRDAEYIVDTNTFLLPKRSNLYKNDKVRLDFTEMVGTGELLAHKVGLMTNKGEGLISSYVFCLDSITNNGHAHIRKDKFIEALIPAQFVGQGSKIYYSPDNDKKTWKLYETPVYDSFHNTYMIKIKDEGCFAVARPMEQEKMVQLTASYSNKSQDAKTLGTPEFFFVYSTANSIVAADSVAAGTVYFNKVKEGASGTIIGIVENDGNNMYLAKEPATIKAHHNNNNKPVHHHGHMKFNKVNHFEMENMLSTVGD